MSLLRQLKNELREKKSLDKLNRGDLVALEQAWLKDHIESEGKCEKCPRKDNLTLDHIIPKDILKQFGIDTEREFMEENLRILCKTCNIFKGNQLDFSTPKTKEIMLKLLSKV